MGKVQHDVIIVSSAHLGKIREAWYKTVELRLIVTGIVQAPVNILHTFVITPDGSEEGWLESRCYDQRRKDFIKWAEDTFETLTIVGISYGELGTKITHTTEKENMYGPTDNALLLVASELLREGLAEFESSADCTALELKTIALLKKIEAK